MHLQILYNLYGPMRIYLYTKATSLPTNHPPTTHISTLALLHKFQQVTNLSD